MRRFILHIVYINRYSDVTYNLYYYQPISVYWRKKVFKNLYNKNAHTFVLNNNENTIFRTKN